MNESSIRVKKEVCDDLLTNSHESQTRQQNRNIGELNERERKREVKRKQVVGGPLLSK